MGQNESSRINLNTIQYSLIVSGPLGYSIDLPAAVATLPSAVATLPSTVASILPPELQEGLPGLLLGLLPLLSPLLILPIWFLTGLMEFTKFYWIIDTVPTPNPPPLLGLVVQGFFSGTGKG